MKEIAEIVELPDVVNTATTNDGSLLELQESFDIGGMPLYLYKIVHTDNEMFEDFSSMVYTEHGKAFLADPESYFAEDIRIVSTNTGAFDVCTPLGSFDDLDIDGYDGFDEFPEGDDYMSQFYDEDCDSGMGTYLSDGIYVRSDGSLYDSK